jgi:hypothetical protein
LVHHQHLNQHADGRRGSPAREPLPTAPPTVREVTNWLCRRPGTLTDDEKASLDAILGRCPELPHWITAARLPGISSFAKGLKQDLDAVTNGLLLTAQSSPPTARRRCDRDRRQPP